MARARLYVCPAAAAANCNRPASRAPALLPQSPAKKAAAKPKAAAAPKVKKTTTTKVRPPAWLPWLPRPPLPSSPPATSPPARAALGQGRRDRRQLAAGTLALR